MSHLTVNGISFAVSPRDWRLNYWLPLWDDDGQVRKTPRNIHDKSLFKFLLMMLFIAMPVGWLISHIPFFGLDGISIMMALFVISIAYRPYANITRAYFIGTLCFLLYSFDIKLGLTFFGLHYEKLIYGLGLLMSGGTLLARLFNAYCWKQIDRICQQYGIPHYDQKALMDAYEGYDTQYKVQPTVYTSYQAGAELKKI